MVVATNRSIYTSVTVPNLVDFAELDVGRVHPWVGLGWVTVYRSFVERLFMTIYGYLLMVTDSGTVCRCTLSQKAERVESIELYSSLGTTGWTFNGHVKCVLILCPSEL